MSFLTILVFFLDKNYFKCCHLLFVVSTLNIKSSVVVINSYCSGFSRYFMWELFWRMELKSRAGSRGGDSKKQIMNVPCEESGGGRGLGGGAHGVVLVVHTDGGRLAGAAVALGCGGLRQVAEGAVDEHLPEHRTTGRRDHLVPSLLGAPRQGRRVHVHMTAPHGRRSATDGQRRRGTVRALRTQLHRHRLRVDLEQAGGSRKGQLYEEFLTRHKS